MYVVSGVSYGVLVWEGGGCIYMEEEGMAIAAIASCLFARLIEYRDVCIQRMDHPLSVPSPSLIIRPKGCGN